MTGEKRWIDELPFESAERELLVAGKSARPHGDDVDANWRAFCVAAGGAGAAAAGGGAAHAASAKAVSGIVSKASVGGLLSAATLKTFAVGVALGVGVSGTSAVVQRLGRREVPRAMVVERKAAIPSRPAPAAAVPPKALVAEPPLELPEATTGERNPAPDRPAAAGARALPSTASVQAEVPAASPPASSAAVMADAVSLSQQARELARVKRLLDAGATLDALRQLEASFGAGAASSLSEERDALYVQALERGGRRAEARTRARAFVSRYPRSPYVASIRPVAEE